MNFLFTFITLSVINVVFSTARSILTIKGGKLLASLISGGYFAFYNIMLIYTVAEFPMWQKCVITFACNVIGVWIVKFIEEKLRKDRLWKIEFTTNNSKDKIERLLTEQAIPHNYIECGKHTVFNCYCATQDESKIVKDIIELYGAKFFASETTLL